MWFKNLKLYAITQDMDFKEQDFEDKLAEFKFRPCGSQELATMGWASPFNQGETLIHATAGRIWLTLKKARTYFASCCGECRTRRQSSANRN